MPDLRHRVRYRHSNYYRHGRLHHDGDGADAGRHGRTSCRNKSGCWHRMWPWYHLHQQDNICHSRNSDWQIWCNSVSPWCRWHRRPSPYLHYLPVHRTNPCCESRYLCYSAIFQYRRPDRAGYQDYELQHQQRY